MCIRDSGNPVKCSTCGSEYHLRRCCPRGKGQVKSGKDKGSSGGLPSTLYTQQMPGGLSEVRLSHKE
eukprot:2870805-Prorocentrum_lima.AAC.1